MVYLHEPSLSPDPTIGRAVRALDGDRVTLDVHPHALVGAVPYSPAIRAWGASLNLQRPHRPLALGAAEPGPRELSLDFGTELEAELVIECTVDESCSVAVLFGESPLEITGIALPTIVPDVPLPVEHRVFARSGRGSMLFSSRGFRFARVVFADTARPVTIHRICARSVFACSAHSGSFSCDDPALQRLWHSSVYTARLCTRPDAYWDGIKRDRVGWYGDARITQQTMDSAFASPSQAVAMLLQMPVDSWANAIPAYSFDGVAMMRQVLLRYGAVPESRDIFERIKRMIDWTVRTQTNRDGLFVHNSSVNYFFGVGFVDWSPMPVGGRFEEVFWMQARWLEALRTAAHIAQWLGHRTECRAWTRRADSLENVLRARFYRPGTGFAHTLNLAARAWEKNEPNRHYELSYVKKVRLGRSGPSRHSSALAVFAGMVHAASHARDVLKALDSPRIEPVITPYFAWYEQCARAECGDVAGAMSAMLGYVGRQVLENDSACTWESYEPTVTGLARWSLGRWAKSLCHGWSTGIVPMTARYMLGVRPVAPSFDVVELRPCLDLPWSFDATVPTPHGPIRAVRQDIREPVVYDIPRTIAVAAGAGVRVRRR